MQSPINYPRTQAADSASRSIRASLSCKAAHEPGRRSPSSSALAQSAPVTVDPWNDLADDITVTVTGRRRRPRSSPLQGRRLPPRLGDARVLTVRFKGCDYVLGFARDGWRISADGATDRSGFYLSDAVQLYIVPPDLILQTPPAFLDPRQPNQFPIDPKKTCAP